MSFTDADLKKLKEHIKDGEPRGFVNFHTDDLADLVGRLEAAERAAQFMYISALPIDDASEEAYQAWRKACGK